MTNARPKTVRVVHLDPDGFGDVSRERAVFEAAYDDLVFDAVWPGERGNLADIGPAQMLLTHYTEIDDAAMAATGPEVIVRYAAGVDGVDLEAATRRGIRVTRIPEYCDAEVGEHVFAMALALWRRLPQYDAHVGTGGRDFHHATRGLVFPGGERRCRELGSQYAIEGLEGRTSEGLVNPEALKGK